MGLHFSKELQLLTQEISLGGCPNEKVTEVQERLVNKLGPNASPFFVHLPENAPCSVQLHPGTEETVSVGGFGDDVDERDFDIETDRQTYGRPYTCRERKNWDTNEYLTKKL